MKKSNKLSNQKWFGVKCLFHHKDLDLRNQKHNYEERVILVLASSFDEAIKNAELDANEYCDDLEGGIEYLKFCNAFQIGKVKIDNRTEVYSLITTSNLNAKQFLDTHYDTGGEATQR